ncbi:MAG TPA: lysine--tRNA ligase [Candidatus Binatus sp.]|uniref:lysine--tRNA ligase n=1 Tax=Candidatus Binatus sp. TaxID=2811406 RepID=UPI002B471C60|nr:lysine--tRNA ligase [Candidatus Binatus sp.]HKN12398.1 lysine--tRNA ligase [Candidatus Binatus sp.]
MAGASRSDSQPGNSIVAELWPREEARRLAERISAYEPARPVIFQSGFGPSGLPHLGTMAEILRPSFVRKAFHLLEPSRRSRLIVFIDDLDGLRKVPENVPDREDVEQYLGIPVSKIPDPFGCCASFADHMIGLLGGFLAPVEVEYELVRSAEMYSSGRFDEGLKLILEKHAEIIAIIAPTLREENRAGWSPFMPICPKCGQVVERAVTAYHPERTSIEFTCEKSAGGTSGCGFSGEQSVLGGMAKVQWKVDWALRWYVLKVDYELYGKDLTDSARLSGQILRVLGAKPPLGFPFEMFLDEDGRKVSKSVGRGVSVDQWTRYAPIEVLKFFLLLNPRRARKLFLEAIPQYVDEYLDAVRQYAAESEEQRRESVLEFVMQSTTPRRFNSTLTLGLMMNAVAALGSSDRDFIWNYIVRYDSSIAGDPETEAMGRALMECALNFYRDFIEPTKKLYTPSDAERAQLKSLDAYLRENQGASAEEIEKKIYDLGRANYDKPGKIFPLLYRSILGQERGPRLGAFIRLATPARIVELLDATIARSA